MDARIHLTNHTGATLTAIEFPNRLQMGDLSIEGLYVPYYLPGVKLIRSYFEHPRDFTFTYPSARSFADFRAVDVNSSHLACYIVNPSGRIAPATWGLQNKAGKAFLFHKFQTCIRNGATYDSPLVRFRIGQTVDRAVLAYKSENGVSAYPSISQKLGASFDEVARAPLIKMDFHWIAAAPGASFKSIAARLDMLTAPTLLHPVAYWPVAFDRNYPDFLPPDPAFGTVQDFAVFVRAARAHGMFVMPYTNPTWWDPESPTLKALGPARFGALNRAGNIITENYGPNAGFVVSPDAPATQKRLDEMMRRWSRDVPVDFIFQDQIGSRPWLRDFNPNAPDPLHYADAWLAFTARDRSRRLMTEDGWDRLAETEVAFAGSALTGSTSFDPVNVRWGRESRANRQFGPGVWEPYPLGTFLLHDKVLMYHHDLDPGPMDAGPEVLTWNALFGIIAGYIWPEGYSYQHPDWPSIASAFQHFVLARLAGETLISYDRLANDVYRSRFGHLTIVANWNAREPYELDGFSIAPSGCLIRSDDASIAAGIFLNEFNRAPLSPGPHYLIVERSSSAVTVRQPSGLDTDVTFSVSNAASTARAIDSKGQLIANVPVHVNAGQCWFRYAAFVAGTRVDAYVLTLR